MSHIHHFFQYLRADFGVDYDVAVDLPDKKKLRGFGPLANYADGATAASWRTFADRGCCVVSATDLPPIISLGLLDRSRYYFFQVAPQLSS
jgi:hypothetical protein